MLILAGYLKPTKIMKKILLLVAVAFMATITSCVKDYTCTCTYTPTGGTQQQHSYDMKDIKKSDAQSTCNALGADAIAQGGSCTYK